MQAVIFYGEAFGHRCVIEVLIGRDEHDAARANHERLRVQRRTALALAVYASQ